MCVFRVIKLELLLIWSDFFFFNSEINGFVDDYLLLRKVNNKIVNCYFGLVGLIFYIFGLVFVMFKNFLWLEEINKVVFDMK